MGTIALIPFEGYESKNIIFKKDKDNVFYFLKQRLENVHKMRINTIDMYSSSNEYDVLIYFNLHRKRKYKKLLKKFKGIKILFAWEPEVVMQDNYRQKYIKKFDYIFTWIDNLIDNKKYFKLIYSQWPRENISKVSFKDKKLITLINGNKISYFKGELYTERLRAIKYFEKNFPNDFDLYGMGWDKHLTIKIFYRAITNNRIFKAIKDFFCSFRTPKSFKGAVKDKIKIMSQYKYAICFENMEGVNGYITEKIWDCFRALTVPIYWGAKNITEFIPKDCFIDFRDFKNYKELSNHLLGINEKKYNKMIFNIEKFIQSERAKKWYLEQWAKDNGDKLAELIKQS